MTIARYFRFILSGIMGTFSFVEAQECGDAQNWVDCPNCYENTATISGGIVLKDDVQMGDDGDLFAAFDEDCNVRGIGIMLFPFFGPYDGTPVFEVQLRSNNAGDLLHFQYYDASEDKIYEIVERYEFSINDVIGNVICPIFYNIYNSDIDIYLYFDCPTSLGININYGSNTEISGFQFDVEGVTLTDASGGDAATNDWSISFSATTVLGFGLSGGSIPVGSGTLLSLEFEESVEDRTLNVINVIISDPDGSIMSNSGPGNVEIPSCNNADCNDVCGGNTVEDACGNCGGDCEEHEGVESGETVYYVICGDSVQNDSGPDCMGVCEGPAKYDECGICGGDGSEEHYDCDGICIAEIDCKNECGGSAELDDCDVCTGINGYEPGTCYDCNGESVNGL